MIIFITCNPYNLKKPYPKIEFDNGTGTKEPIDSLSSLWLAQEEPLAESLLPHGDWEGLFPVIVSEWGITEAKIFFVGLREDYCKLKAAYDDYTNTNPRFRAEIIIDEDIIEDISPSSRRKLLLLLYKQWQETAFTELEKFNDAWNKCSELLRNENITDAEAVVSVQEIMSISLQFKDISQQIEKKIDELYSHRRTYEDDRKLTLQESFSRIMMLQKFSSKLSNNVREVISSTEEIMRQETPPQHTECIEIEINGKMKHWVEEIYALSFMENFRGRAMDYYYKVNDLLMKAWQDNICRISATFHDSFIDNCIADLQRISLCNEPNVNVKLIRCTEKYYRPSYWEGNEARECLRNYIDIFAYENDILAVLRKKFNENKKLLNNEADKIIMSLNDNIKKYEDILNEIERLETLRKLIDKLKNVISDLTSIDALILPSHFRDTLS